MPETLLYRLAVRGTITGHFDIGLGIFPTFRPHQPGIQFRFDGKLLLDEYEKLDALALERGISPLSQFGDNREVPDGFEGDPDELAEILGPWDEWFPPPAGVRCLSELIGAVKADRMLASRFEHSESLLEELCDLRRCLMEAEIAGAEFRLDVH